MRKWEKFLLLFLLAFFQPEVATANFTYSQLKILIEENQIKSIDELLPYLPESLRSRFVLMHNSQSVQEATPLQPRVLLFSEDGRMGMAFSTSDPTMVEILELNPQTNKMEPHVVIFDEKGGSKAKIIDDPLSYFPKSHPNHCTRCHSEKMHFNWDTYPRWPGAYGVNNKNLNPFSKENLSLKNLQKQVDEKSLLRHLPKVKSVSLFSLGMRNNIITNRLSETNARRIVQEIKENPNFSRYRAAIFAALLKDRNFDSFLSEEDKIAFKKAYPSLKQDTIERIKNYGVTLTNRQKVTGFGSSLFQRLEQNNQNDPYEVERIAKMRFLADKMGLSSSDWTMTRVPGTYDTTTGAFGLYNDMLTPYVEVLRETDPEIIAGKKFKTSHLGGIGSPWSWRSLAKEIQTKVWAETNEFPEVSCKTFFSKFFR